MPESEDKRLIQFDQLNVLGKAVYLTGAAVRTTASLLDVVMDKAVDLILEAEQAFKEGRDAKVEDAKILKEWQGVRKRR